MLDIIIVGAGGFGREVYQWSKDAFNQDEYRIKGFLSKDSNELDEFAIDAPILGHEDDYQIQDNDRFIIAIGNVAIKKNVVESLKSKGASFVSLIHPTAIVAPSVKIGEGVVICPYSILTDSVIIGDYVMLNVYVYCGHDSKVGKYSILSPYSTLNGYASLEDEVFLATHSVVTGYKNVGSKSVIGANSLVLHDVEGESKVLGLSEKKTQVDS